MRRLKTLFCTLGTFFILVPSLKAQESVPLEAPSRDRPAIYLGGMAGGTVSFIFSIPSIPQVPHWGGTIGASMHIENSRYTALQMALMYTVRGWSEHKPSSIEEAEAMSFSRYIHYIELPVHSHIFYPIGGFRMGLKFGPQIGVMLASHDMGTDASLLGGADKLRHESPLVGKFAWGLSGGPVFSFDFGRHRVQLEGLFYMGFNDLISTRLSDYYRRFGEMMVSVNLSYLFRIR